MNAVTPVTGPGIGGLSATATPSSYGPSALPPEQRPTLGGMRSTPERPLALEQHTRTPVPGLLLARHDGVGLGGAGDTMGRFRAAAHNEPRLGQPVAA